MLGSVVSIRAGLPGTEGVGAGQKGEGRTEGVKETSPKPKSGSLCVVY